MTRARLNLPNLSHWKVASGKQLREKKHSYLWRYMVPQTISELEEHKHSDNTRTDYVSHTCLTLLGESLHPEVLVVFVLRRKLFNMY